MSSISGLTKDSQLIKFAEKALQIIREQNIHPRLPTYPVPADLQISVCNALGHSNRDYVKLLKLYHNLSVNDFLINQNLVQNHVSSEAGYSYEVTPLALQEYPDLFA